MLVALRLHYVLKDGRYECKDDSLYNGVNNRLKYIEFLSNETTTKANSIYLHLERTTFFTTLGMTFIDADKILNNKSSVDYDDVCRIINDYYLNSKYFEEICEFDKYENWCFKELYNGLYPNTENINIYPDQCEVSDLINEYLSMSKTTHYINVSVNITSDEGYLIYAKRGKAEDKNEIYCSANGVSETYDSRVDFYNFSVNEDIPTIQYDQDDRRVSFNEEIGREIEAELNISDMTNRYDFY